jgi:hypothetical protein
MSQNFKRAQSPWHHPAAGTSNLKIPGTARRRVRCRGGSLPARHRRGLCPHCPLVTSTPLPSAARGQRLGGP